MPKESTLRVAALVAIGIGLIASAATEVVHLKTYLDPDATSFCTIGQKLDCTTVSLSRYAVALGVPLPIWGLAGFLAMGIAALKRSWILLPLSAGAAGASVVLLLVELRVIHSVCLVCEGVHLASWVVFGIALLARQQLTPPSRRAAVATLAPSALMVLASWLALPRYWSPVSWKDPVTLPHGVDEGGHRWIGAEKPQLVVHEYLHYGCPHCMIAMARTRRWLSSLGDKVRFVRHQQPLSYCPVIVDKCQFVRIAACAADKGKFWEADAWLFAHAPNRKSVDAKKAADDLGLEPEAFQACVDDPKTFRRVDKEAREAFGQKRTLTPSYYVDDEQLKLRELEARLDAL
jgi:uncharacterized membrane protein